MRYSLSSRIVSHGTQEIPESIQITFMRGNRSGMPFTIQLVQWTMLYHCCDSALTAMNLLTVRNSGSSQSVPPWKAIGRPASSIAE